ncbi:MAG: ecotin [Verrucomicrobiota bacterium]
MKTLTPTFISCLVALAQGLLHAEDPNMKAFPAPEKGMTRHVLSLPARKDESAFKVEILVGKTVKTDPANRFFFAGKIEEETIQGWGFPKYTVRSLGPLAGTRMAVDPKAPATDRFVTLGGEPYLLRYNSRLPVVVYVPEGAGVRYRLWKAEGAPKAVPAQ